MDGAATKAIYDLGLADGGNESQRRNPLAIPYALVPDGYTVQPLEKFMDQPARYERVVTVHGIDELISYAKRFGEPATTAFFADIDNDRITAVIDYNDIDGGAGWAKHIAVYTCPISVEWKTWTGQDGKALDQAAFARFLEDNVADIVRPEGSSGFPSGAEMLELCRNFTANKKATFESAQREASGDFTLTYSEETTGGHKTRQDFKVPETFLLGLPVYKNDKHDDGSVLVYPLVARLRYRVEGGRLGLWFDLLRPDKVKDQAFERQISRITEKLGRQVDGEGEVTREGMLIYRGASPTRG